mmetsp:Transcript_47976/g.104294  ORF Transcript_47976/g.104294 Transcript_47976/m.104294 type:complete len:283 (-) Transcript_47976:771-1619(-)
MHPDPEADGGLSTRHPIRGGHEHVLVHMAFLPLHYVQLDGGVGVTLWVSVVVPSCEALLPPQVGLSEATSYFTGGVVDGDEEIRGSGRLQRLGPSLLLRVVGPEILAPARVSLGLPGGHDGVLVARWRHAVDEQAGGVGVQEPALNNCVEVLVKIFHNHPYCAVSHLLGVAIDQIVRHAVLQSTILRGRATVQQLHVALALELDHPVDDIWVGGPQVNPPHLATLHVRARHPHALALHLHKIDEESVAGNITQVEPTHQSPSKIHKGLFGEASLGNGIPGHV